VVSATEPLKHRHPPPPHHPHLAGLRPCSELELLFAVERRDRDPRAERRLGHRQVHLGEDVVSLANEPRVRPDSNANVDIARPAAGETGVAFTGDADPLTVMDPRRDLDVQPPLLEDLPSAFALRAWMLDQPPAAAALWAILRADELPEGAARDVLDAAEPLAGRADRDLGSRLHTVPRAAGAPNRDSERDFSFHPGRRLPERDLDVGRDVRASAAWAPRRCEQIVAEEGREDVGQVPEVELRRVEAAASEAAVAVPVVELAGLGIREHLVRLDDLLEALLGVRRIRDVRMHLPSKAAKGFLDLGLVGVAAHAEDLVVVALGGRHPEASVARRV